MPNEFDTELDSIFSEREARNVKALQEVARQTAATASFAQAWDQLRANVVVPVFNQAALALARRGVTAGIGELEHGVCLYFKVNAVRSARGRERDGQPYLAVLADANTQLVSFERNRSGAGRGDEIGELPLDKVDADSVRARLLTLIRRAVLGQESCESAELRPYGGLHYVAGDVFLVRPRPIGFGTGGRQDEYHGTAKLRIRAQCFKKLESVHARHVEIEQHEIRFRDPARGVIASQDL
jgi:hypothetical protein